MSVFDFLDTTTLPRWCGMVKICSLCMALETAARTDGYHTLIRGLPSRPIERGRPGAGLLAHVLVTKYADHCPLYRQSQIFAREGIDLDRSTLAGWVGQSTKLLEPLADAIGRYVKTGQAIFADDTPIRMQAKKKCATARIWTYVRDERPWVSGVPPAAWYKFSTDREGKHPTDHLGQFEGWIHADGYTGFNKLFGKDGVQEMACMAHARRKFVDIFKSQGLEIAEEAIRRIALLYKVEKAARGKVPRYVEPDGMEHWWDVNEHVIRTNDENVFLSFHEYYTREYVGHSYAKLHFDGDFVTITQDASPSDRVVLSPNFRERTETGELIWRIDWIFRKFELPDNEKYPWVRHADVLPVVPIQGMGAFKNSDQQDRFIHLITTLLSRHDTLVENALIGLEAKGKVIFGDDLKRAFEAGELVGSISSQNCGQREVISNDKCRTAYAR